MQTTKPLRPEPCCLNCAFLYCYVPGAGLGGGLLDGPTPNEYRDEFRGSGLPTAATGHVMKNGREAGFYCSRGVWRFTGDPRHVWKKDRTDECFFFPHADDTTDEAAKELERRGTDRREAEKDRALTRGALRFTFAALIVSILATVANIIIQLVK